MNLFFKKNYIHFLFLFVLFFPHNNSVYNGLPFSSPLEYLLILVIVPIFYLLKFFNQIDLKLVRLLIIIFFIKLSLVFSPQNGILIKQYFNSEELKQDKYIKTFDTFWNKSFSAIQINDWKEKRHFPIDWVLDSSVNQKSENPKIKHVNSHQDFHALSLFYKIQFWIFVEKDSSFKINAEGANQQQSSVVIKKGDTNIQKLLLNENIYLKKGIYEIAGNIHFLGNKKWVLYPSIVDKKGYFISAFKKNIIFSENINKKNSFYLNYVSISGIIFDFLLILFLIIIFLKKIKNCYIFFLLSFCSLVFYLFINQIFLYFNLFEIDSFGSTTLTINIIFMLCLLLLLLYKKKISFTDQKLIPQLHFLIYLIPVLVFFFTKNYSEIYSVKAWSWGDDWDIFQSFSRQIVVNGDWLVAGEKIFYYRPLMRYVNAIHRVFFGWSNFASIITEVWCVIFISYYTHLACSNLKINNYVALILSSLLLGLYFGENYRWLIGRGLPEYYAAALIMLTIYLLGKNKISTKNLIICIIIGIFGTWLREDHGLLLVSLVFFIPFQFYQKNGLLEVLTIFFKKHFSTIFKFAFFITSGFALLFLRNYYLSGDFAFLTHPSLVGNMERDELSIWTNMFLGVHIDSNEFEKNIFYKLPRSYSIFLISGIVLSIVAIWKIKYINNNFALPVAIFSICFPYFFINNVGYAPRFTIHYLPFCLLIVGSYFTYIINKNYKIIKI